MLIYVEKVKRNQLQFVEKIKSISNALKIDPNWLMILINAESAGTFSPSVRNPNGGATGLIQFMPATARGLGTSTEALAKMTNVQQLDWVYKYFKPYTGRIKSYFDLYLATFFPAGIGKNDDYVFATKKLPASVIARDNKGIDRWPRDGKITMAEFKQYVRSTIPPQAISIIESIDSKKK